MRNHCVLSQGNKKSDPPRRATVPARTTTMRQRRRKSGTRNLTAWRSELADIFQRIFLVVSYQQSNAPAGDLMQGLRRPDTLFGTERLFQGSQIIEEQFVDDAVVCIPIQMMQYVTG